MASRKTKSKSSEIIKKDSAKPTVSIINLEFPGHVKTVHDAKVKWIKKGKKDYCETSGFDSGSGRTRSIENLQTKENPKGKPIVLVKQKESLEQLSYCTVTPLHSTESINRYFKGILTRVPTHKVCVLSTSSSIEETVNTYDARESLDDRQSFGSQEMIDSAHLDTSEKPKKLRGIEWKQPCKQSVIAGAPKPYIGKCPPHYEDIVKESKPRQKFLMTQNPRDKFCLRNPECLRAKRFSEKREFEELTAMVKYAENICDDSKSQSSESYVCDRIDLENPLNLDFQGLDYQRTYEKDEQDTQNTKLYRQIVRNMERNRVKKQTTETVEKELHQERIAVPECFEIAHRDLEITPPPTPEPFQYGKLIRSDQKSYNKELLEMERQRRRERYKSLYMKKKERENAERIQKEKQKQEEEENQAFIFAKKNLDETVQEIEDAIVRSFQKEHVFLPTKRKLRRFPHTTQETTRFKKRFKKQKRIERERAIVKQDFFQKRLGKEKYYPEVELEISSDSDETDDALESLSSQSTNDDDNMEVGLVGDSYKLRGFHFKLGQHICNKARADNAPGTRKPKGCITRQEWVTQLVPKKRQIKLDMEEGLLKLRDTDDVDLALFQSEFRFRKPKIASGAIKSYIQEPLGQHYVESRIKKLKVIKPRLKYNPKKFDLIKYIFGDSDDKRYLMAAHQSTTHEPMKNISTMEYMRDLELKKQRQKKFEKEERLKLMGIPCADKNSEESRMNCEEEEFEPDTEWVPETEPPLTTEKDKTHVPFRMRYNMPAPTERETTLRRHPRHPRDYEKLRVPSQILNEAIVNTGIPYLAKVQPDKYQYANVRSKKRPYTDLFNARHHHDHWDPTQKKLVNVHYKARIVKPEIPKIEKRSKLGVLYFRKANPPCNKHKYEDLTKVRINIDHLKDEYKVNQKRRADSVYKIDDRSKCNMEDFIYHSRPKEEMLEKDYPGRQEYLNFLNQIRGSLHELKLETKKTTVINKDAYIKELEEDLQSIESCLTSVSSSDCTNFTNDSGSFLLVEGKTKVPMDYLRKSMVPYEATARSAFIVEPVDVNEDRKDPYMVVPFSGQYKEQLEMSAAKDKFFTFNTRLRNGMRLRLQVPVENIHDKLVGMGIHKYKPMVATDIDEDYVDTLKDRPRLKLAHFCSGRSFVKDALRLKYESLLIQGMIVRTKIYDRLNEYHWQKMMMAKKLYEKLFAKWEKHEYEAAMSVVYKVKSYYEITDVLRKEYREYERELLLLNMDIVFIEGVFIRRQMLQNFHYLMADQDWRYQNDWIHRLDDDPTELENLDASIAKRSTVNIRARDKDDAWAIKDFFENVYLKNKHPLLFVFEDSKSFVKGIENLKSKTFVLLLELHLTLSISTELQSRLEIFREWCREDLKEKEEYVARKCAKLYFMENRARELKRRTHLYTDEALNKAINTDTLNKNRAVIAEVWRYIVPTSLRGSSETVPDASDMVGMISDVLIELLGKFENIPKELRQRVENRVRHRFAYESKISQQAVQLERRIEHEMLRVRRNLEATDKPKRVGKLPRLKLKKKEIKIEEVVQPISENAKLFLRAFTDEETSVIEGSQESLYMKDTAEEQIVPFYFDHFLKLNGYTPNYNFKTQVELRDGLEVERMTVRAAIPEVLERIEQWEKSKRTVMQENITRNPRMYVDVI